MQADELDRKNFDGLFAGMPDDDLTPEKKFLKWFLLMHLGLSHQDAYDVICDGPNDRGIDGVLIDNDRQAVIYLQSKTKVADNPDLGDKDIREFAGSIEQANTSEKISELLASKIHKDLRDVLVRYNVAKLIEDGYSARGIFVTNATADANGISAVKNSDLIELYDRKRLVSEFIDIEKPGGVYKKVDLSLMSDSIVYNVNEKLSQITFLAKAKELADLDGIEDQSLFDLNVRNPLGSTKVNVGLRKTIQQQEQHNLFPLFHNGIVMLCDEIQLKEKTIELTNFAVVNGAQSIKQLHLNADSISDELFVQVRAVNAGLTSDLAKVITDRTNTQNGVSARDRRSNDIRQDKLASEINNLGLGHFYEYKRGAVAKGEVISNQLAAQMLLSFDLDEPHNTHQVSSLFDSKYDQIFSRLIVDGARIVALFEIFKTIWARSAEFSNKSFGSYAQTRFFLLSGVAQILKESEEGEKVFLELSPLLRQGKLKNIIDISNDILSDLIPDLDFEFKDNKALAAESFKSYMKNKETISILISTLKRERTKSVSKGRSLSVEDLISKKL